MRTFFNLFLLALCACCLSFCGTQSGDKNKIPGSDTTAAALEKLNERLRNDPGNAALYQQRARLELRKKSFDASLADMKRAIAIDSTKAEYYMTLSDVSFAMNKSGTAKQALEKCHRLDPGNADCIMKLAELYFYVRKYQESLNFLDEALLLDKFNAKAYFMKGMNFKETGDTTKAISSMQTAVEQDNTYYNAYIQLGLLFAAKHDKLGEDYFNNALKLQPENPEVLYDLARMYQDEQKYKEAASLYQRMLAINKNFFDAQYNLGVVMVDLKSYAEALNFFSNAIGIQPKNPKPYYARGYAYQLMGNFQNAATDYRYSLTLDPELDAAKQRLAEMHLK
ncbi:MAG TPA: tetratricopeptide repeat protein [Bacteroidia bacterium]|jgi:tetratricopeptide (TPR) repeat protein|nr:tetratricopeptide repeat protein [Bacteroidia bacterium]